MRFTHRAVLTTILLCVGSWSSSRAQQIERVIRTIDGTQPLICPVQVMLSPSANRVAICDQQANRIYVIDIDGNPIWTIGAGLVVTQPTLISFERDDAVLYYMKSEQMIFRSREANPDAPDTVARIADSVLDDLSLDRAIALAGEHQGYLVLDREQGTVLRLKADWTLDRKLISQGSGKGRLWSPTDFAVDQSGNIIVSDESGCPVQSFTSEGEPLFCGSWNLADAQRSWNCASVGVAPGEAIWSVDVTNQCWRVFDRAGIQISQYAFQAPLFEPNSFVITPDNRMFVADDNGAIIVMSLP